MKCLSLVVRDVQLVTTNIRFTLKMRISDLCHVGLWKPDLPLTLVILESVSRRRGEGTSGADHLVSL